MAEETVIVQVRYTIAPLGHYPTFHDSLVFTAAEYAALQPGDIAALEVAHYATWRAAYDDAITPVVPTRPLVIALLRNELAAIFTRRQARDQDITDATALGSAPTVVEMRASLLAAGYDLTLVQVSALMTQT